MQVEDSKPSWRGAVAMTVVVSILSLAAWAEARPNVLTNPTVNLPLAADVSIPLRDMPRETGPLHGGIHPVLYPKVARLGQAVGVAATAPPSAQFTTGTQVAATVGLNFDGIDQIDPNVVPPPVPPPPDATTCDTVTGSTVAPPDTNAAVGDTQIVEWTNLCYAVFDKASGALVAGPFPGNQFWQGFGRGCQEENSGDPIIQWDKLAHRWVAFQNIFIYPYEACIAISKTADATGSYFRYVYNLLQGFPDYPKVGIMPDAYYQSQNNFGPAANAFVGVTVCAYQRALLLKGSTTAKQVCFVDKSNNTGFDDSMLPADLDSPAHPPAHGQPEVFLGTIDSHLTGDTAVYKYLFHVNWTYPKLSTFRGVDGAFPITVPTFNLALCTVGNPPQLTPDCVSQPGGFPLDTLGDRLMYRLAYTSDGTTQNWVVTHTVNNTTATAVRWYQFTAPQGSTNISLAQAGETPDDGEFRWMGSIARDKAGDLAVGYSRSSSATGDLPSIYYAGQQAGEPKGRTDSENLLFAGFGYDNSNVNRWGDYTSMALDAADGCTFVYANEYLRTNNDGWAWRTRVASLKFPNCQ